jgi:hypothetical protein
MPLSSEEIDKLLLKLRERYREYAKKHNRSWFNVEAFEERYAMAVQNRMNLEGFILAEISNFEKVREKYESKKKKKEFTSRVDRIMEENIERIKKYPEIEFHPMAGIEIKYFYGALSEFSVYYYPLLWTLVTDFGFRDKIEMTGRKLDLLAGPHGKVHPKRINDHIYLLKEGKSGLDIERDCSSYLRESAFILHEIIDMCDDIIELKEPHWEAPLTFEKLYLESDRKKSIIEIFSGVTGYGAILAVKERAGDILEDFRLAAFKSKGNL